MKIVYRWLIGLVVGLVLAVVVAAGIIIASPQGKLKLPVEQTAVFTHDAIATFPAPLHADGNQLVNAQGDAVRLQGIMPVDPAVLHNQNRFNRRYFEELAATGANVIRLPVHPHYWETNPDYLWRYIEPAAAWSGELGMYLIIDWHSIGNPKLGTAPLMPELYNHDWEMTTAFWTAVATHFHDTPHVLFEIFNEPQAIRPNQWQPAATELAAIIRAQNAQQPIIVGGVDYAKDLRWVLENPIPDNNVAYAAHIYPQHNRLTWPLYFGDVAAHYPVLITEWGFMDEVTSENQSDLLSGTAESYGQPLLTYMAEHNIGWTACWYDTIWEPPMLDNGRHPNNFGTFVLEALAN